jgi:hypothetical protein
VDAHNDIYELAYARYHDPIFLTGLKGSDRSSNSVMFSYFALWFGVDKLPAAQPGAFGSHDFPSGYAILRRGDSSDATWFCLKYAPHAGEHSHPDKNSFVLYTGGRMLLPDPGTRPYGSPLHYEWDRVTLSHNTLVVDETSQTPTAGKTLAFGQDHGADYVMSDAGGIYPGVRFVRTAVLLNQNLLVFVDRVTSDRPHTLDIAVHAIGSWNQLLLGKPVTLPGHDGYQHLADVSARAADPVTTLLVDTPLGHKAAITLAGTEPTEVITATGVGASTEDRVPMAIFRRHARSTTFVWAVSLDGTPAALKAETDAAGRTKVRAGSWTIAVDTEHPSVSVMPAQ